MSSASVDEHKGSTEHEHGSAFLALDTNIYQTIGRSARIRQPPASTRQTERISPPVLWTEKKYKSSIGMARTIQGIRTLHLAILNVSFTNIQ